MGKRLQRLRRWVKRIAMALVAMLLLLVLAAWVARQWLIPALIRAELVEGVSQVWDGRVSVREVRFRYFGPIELRGLRLEDRQGRLWLELRSLRAHLRDWPSLHPVLEELEFDRVVVNAHLAEGEEPPLRAPEEPAPPTLEQYVDLRRIRVHELIVSLDYAGQVLEMEDMRIAVDRRGDTYLFLVEPLVQRGDRLQIRGSFEPDSGQLRAAGTVSRFIRHAEVGLLQVLTGGALPIERAQGQLIVEGRVEGTLQDLASLEIVATGRLSEAWVELPQEVRADDLRASFAFRDGTLHVDPLTARVFGGRLRAQAAVSLLNGPPGYQGRLAVDRIDLALLAERLEVPVLRDGQAGGEFLFAARAGGPLRLEGQGRIDAGLDLGPVNRAAGPFALALEWDPSALPAGWRGRVELGGWRILTAQGLLADDMAAEATLEGQELRLERAAGRIAGGTLRAAGRMHLPDDWPQEPGAFQASLSLRHLQLNALLQVAAAAGDEVPDQTDAADGVLDVEAEIRGEAGAHTAAIALTGTAAVTRKQDHLAGGYEMRLHSPAAPDETAMLTGRLTGWTWTHDRIDLLTLRTAQFEAHDGQLIVPEALVVAAGGSVALQGRAQRGPEGAIRYRGRFQTRDFDPLALLPRDEPPPLTARLTLDGTFTGQAAEQFSATARGHVGSAWLQPEEWSAAGELAVNVFARDLAGPDPLERLAVQVDLTDGAVRRGDDPVVHDLTASARLVEGGRGEMGFSGRAMGGRFAGEAQGQVREGELAYTALLSLARTDVAHLPAAVEIPPQLRAALVNAELRLDGQGVQSLRLRGAGDLTARFDAEPVNEAQGRYEMDLHFSGLAAGETLQLEGTARLEDWVLRGSRGVLADNVRISALAFGRSADVSSLRGSLLGGRVHGLFRLDLPADEPLSFRGGLTINGLDLAAAAAAMNGDANDVAGQADLTYRFAGRRFTPRDINGRGALQVRDSRMAGVPLLQAMLAELQLRPEAAHDTDLDLAFDHAGEVMTIRGGRLATPLAAMTPLPGGTVNLETRELDLYVVAAALDDLSGLVNVPVLELLAPLAGRLTQLHVTGTWDSRETIRVRKQPVRDVAEGIAEFFAGVLRTGGDLGQTFLQPIGQMAP